ncbi:dormancy-associated protein homolog 3-like isoform X2 [Hibiscus syriacus]|uniref:dormancy-associated protein homolog 3-like isoform X2 n=1 Tax=Hibiscus syriacus TaxID=106335 RepID=UPI00192277C8|nr:dormancy-associated protein homolog 3-like isoform X2 [Hibiscus syriacus]
MGLLDQLWDDTVAGPLPDDGLGKIRKHSSFTFRPKSSNESDGGSLRPFSVETLSEKTTKVTRSMMIIKSPRYQSGSPPVSPAESTPPVSPFSSKESFWFWRRPTSDAYEKAGSNIGPRSAPPPHDM